jgi:hypothetical protein
MLYLDEASARAAVTLHSIVTTFTLTETDRPSVSMTYVTNGAVDVTLGTDAQSWIVSVGFQEVTP